jgi:hypothetical protein
VIHRILLEADSEIGRPGRKMTAPFCLFSEMPIS